MRGREFGQRLMDDRTTCKLACICSSVAPLLHVLRKIEMIGTTTISCRRSRLVVSGLDAKIHFTTYFEGLVPSPL